MFFHDTEQIQTRESLKVKCEELTYAAGLRGNQKTLMTQQWEEKNEKEFLTRTYPSSMQRLRKRRKVMRKPRKGMVERFLRHLILSRDFQTSLMLFNLSPGSVTKPRPSTTTHQPWARLTADKAALNRLAASPLVNILPPPQHDIRSRLNCFSKKQQNTRLLPPELSWI